MLILEDECWTKFLELAAESLKTQGNNLKLGTYNSDRLGDRLEMRCNYLRKNLER
jgi:hypothetical protein